MRTQSFRVALLAGLALFAPLEIALAAGAVPSLAGGRVTAIASDARTGLAIASDSSGVFRSASVTSLAWQAENLEAGSAVLALAFDGQGSLWAAAGAQGLWKREASGAWQAVDALAGASPNTLRSDSTGKVWVGTSRGLLRPQSDGSLASVGELKGAVQALAFLAEQAFVVANNDVWTLNTSGEWQATKLGATPISLASDGKSVLVAATVNGVWRYAGGNWQSLGPNKVVVNAAWVDADGTIWAGTDRKGVQKFTGISWAPMTQGANGRRVLSLIRDTQGRLIAGTVGGVVQVDDGTTANIVQGPGGADAFNQGLSGVTVRAMQSLKKDVFAAIPGRGVLRWTEDGAAWADASLGLDDDVLFLAQEKTDLFAVTEVGKAFQWDGANAWADLNVPQVGAPRAFAVDKDGGLWLSTAQSGGVWQRQAKDKTWQLATGGLPPATVTSFAVASNGDLYAGTDKAGVFVRSKNATSWTSAGDAGLPVTATRQGGAVIPINALAFDGGRLYAGTDHGVYVRKPSGNEWDTLVTGLAELRINSLVVTAKGDVVAATPGGAFILASNGKSWSPFGESQGEDVRSLTLLGDRVLIGTRPQPGKGGKVKG